MSTCLTAVGLTMMGGLFEMGFEIELFVPDGVDTGVWCIPLRAVSATCVLVGLLFRSFKAVAAFLGEGRAAALLEGLGWDAKDADAG
jgi:hypothetical protein